MANSTKTQDKRRGASVFAAVLILSALIGGVCLCGYVSRNDSGKWFQNPNLSTWHWVDELAYDGDTVAGVNHSVHNHATSLTLDEDGNAGITPYIDSIRCPDCGGWAYEYRREYGSCTKEEIVYYRCDDTESCGYFGSVNKGVQHSYSWVITTKPVGDKAGVESYICGECSDVTETRTVFALPADPVKEGYHFVGWYTDEALTSPYNSDYIYADTNLYAKFEINICNVTFDSDGGSEIDSISVEWNTAITPEVPEKTGYNFLGWYKSDGTKFENGDLITTDTVLSARWQIKTFTVTFYVNGELYATVTVEYGSVLSKVADDAAVYANNILSFENVNGETPAVNANEMIIADDMIVMANEPSKIEKIFKSKYMPYAIGGVCALVLLTGIIIAAVAKKKRG